VICQERVRLLGNYRDTATDYAGKVRELVELAMGGRESESNAQRVLCRAAWEACESSRLALARHEADHACDRAGNLRGVEGLDAV
jgi:hypothetical protein